MTARRRGAEFAGARLRPSQRPAELLERASAWGNAHGIEIQLVDARGVCRPLHLQASLLHAERAIARGRNRANTRATELLLWLAGERQIHRAIARLGVKRSTRSVAVICFAPGRLSRLLRHLGLLRDDRVLDATPQKLRAQGFTQTAVRSLPKELWPLLVLERTARAELPQ